MSVEREYASKGVAGTGLGLGAAGTVTGIAGTLMSVISLINEGRRDRAEVAAAGLGLSVADVMALMATMTNRGGCGCVEAVPAPMYAAPMCAEAMPATHYDLHTNQIIAGKDAEIAGLKSDKDTDNKIIALNADVTARFNRMAEDNGVKFDAIFKVMCENATAAAEAKVRAEYNEKALHQLQGRVGHLEGEINAQAVYNGINTERLGCIKQSVNAQQRMLGGLTRVVIPSGNVCTSAAATELSSIATSVATIAEEID